MKKLCQSAIFAIFPFILLGQNITVEYKSKLLNIDSVVIYDPEGLRIGNYVNMGELDLRKEGLVTVIHTHNRKTLCMRILYEKVLCDTVRVILTKFPRKCKYVYETVGSYQTCQGMSQSVGIFSNYAPCCTEKRKRRHPLRPLLIE